MSFKEQDERPFIVFQLAMEKVRKAAEEAEQAQRPRLPDVQDAWPFKGSPEQKNSEG